MQEKDWHQYDSCYTPHCPRREGCTLWHNAQKFMSERRMGLGVTNPQLIEQLGGYDHCPRFYEWRLRQFARFLVWNYPDLTGRQWQAIKYDLVSAFSENTLKRFRNGYEAISPGEQERIAEVFARHSPDVRPRYKRTEEHYLKPPRIEGKEARKLL